MTDAEDAHSRFFDTMERELLESVVGGEDDDGMAGDDFGLGNMRQEDAAGKFGGGNASSPSSRSIPVPIMSGASSPLPAPSSMQPSSQGSSGSAFLSSVLNQGGGVLSHTPPVASSYEVSHFGKRARSGSVSGRIRSASEYLEDRGLLDRQTKGMLKDLIIIGDEELQRALDSYDAGDPSLLEEMISSGALQNRMPADLDLMGDLDLDFLTMNESANDLEEEEPPQETVISQGPPTHQPLRMPPMLPSFSQQKQAPHTRSGGASNMVSPEYEHTPEDDGIGDLEFNEFMSETDYLSMQNTNAFEGKQSSQQASVMSNASSAAGSPAMESTMMSEYERRLRSNSLFSALLDPTPTTSRGRENSIASIGSALMQDASLWMESIPEPVAERGGGIHISRKQPMSRRQSAPELHSAGGIGASLMMEESSTRREKKTRKEKKDTKMAEEDDDEEEQEHVPGSGRPRTLSDPNLRTSYDQHGLMQVERPDGWIGAYSPESRKVRIERFLEKRNHRVWSKTIKYDVRKNFADSRLRVKGRFVRKEDETLMRELMSLT